MVRTRSHEAPLVGLLAALAAFCALEARGGQPYSIVGQSSAETAATGRRPLAERIKSSNRPIRIAAEAELAPDRGLIPTLSGGVTFPPERDWVPVPAVVEMPEGAPTLVVGADEPSGPASPAVIPPPDAEALAANPTTSDDAGFIDEASSTDPDAVPSEGLQALAAADVDATAETGAQTATGPAPGAGRVSRAAPPRRATTRITPQRREALLDRLRAALAEMPRPLGLVPASPKHRPMPQQARRHPRPATPATTAPAELSAVPAAAIPETAPPEEIALDAADDTGDVGTADDRAEPTDAVSDLATAEEAGEQTVPPSETPAETPLHAGLALEAPLDTPTALADAAIDPAAGVAADVDGAESLPATDEGTILKAESSLAATPQPAAVPRQGTVGGRGSRAAGPRVGNPTGPVHRQGPFDRLQARLEAMPRSLGLLPAPRPSMHAGGSQRPRATVPHRHQPSGSPAIPVPQSAAVEEVAATAGSAVQDADLAAETPEIAPADPVADESFGTLDALVAEVCEQDDPTPVDGDRPADPIETAVVADDEATAEGPVAAPEAEGIDSALLALSESPSDAEPATLEGEADASTEPQAPVAPPAVARPARQGHAPRTVAPRSIVQHPFRDRLANALATMPRPLGILPAPQTAPQRRPTAPRTTGAPQLLAKRHPAPRPLDVPAASAAGVEVAAPEGPENGAADETTTLASGSDLHDETMPAGPDAATVADSAPATLPPLAESDEIAAACIEVSVSAPEEATVVGEQVTLHFTIRNTGNASASAVTPVIHFAAGLEPVGIQGRHGSVTADGSVVFDRCPELAAGAGVEIDVIVTCTAAGQVAYQGVAWCGEGASAEQVPVNGQVNVVPAQLAAEPSALPHRR